MDTLFELFSWFCGQPADRCFIIDGHMLPVCQRCLGVWSGVLLGAILAPGAFRRLAVRPGRLGLVFVGVAIVNMFVMGLHWIDPGPIARFVCGFAYGAALIWVALPVAKSWVFDLPVQPASGRETLRFLGLSTVSAIALSLLIVIGSPVAYPVCSTLAVLGVAAAAAAIVGLVAGRVMLVARRLRSGPPEPISRP